MRKLEVGDFVSVSVPDEGWVYLQATPQSFVDSLLVCSHSDVLVWQFGLHESLLPDNWQLVEKRTTSAMDTAIADTLEYCSLQDVYPHELAFLAALALAPKFEGRA